MGYFAALFSSSQYMPHGYCYSWPPGLVPITLIYFIRKRRDLPFKSSSVWCVPFGLWHHASLPDLIHNSSGVSSRAKTLAEAERQHILQALRETDWVMVGLEGAAVQLGVGGGGVLQRRPSEKVKRHNDARSCGRREDMGGS
jgi:hypothetical protein